MKNTPLPAPKIKQQKKGKRRHADRIRSESNEGRPLGADRMDQYLIECERCTAAIARELRAFARWSKALKCEKGPAFAEPFETLPAGLVIRRPS